MKRNSVKYLGAIFICLFVFLWFHMFFQNDNSFHHQKYYLDDDSSNLETPKIAIDDPNGKSLLVQQYANISNSQNYFNINSGENVSFNLVSDWTSKNVTINYKGIGQKKDIVANGRFDSNKSGWVFRTNNDTQYVEELYNPNGGPDGDGDGCLVMGVTDATKNQGDYGYYEQNITLQEELYPLDAYFSIDYYYSFWKKPDNCSLFMAVIIGNVNRNKTLNLNDIANDREWFTMSLEYNPETYGQILPGNVTVRAGIWTNELSTSDSAELRLDNIKYELWTKPNQTGIIKVYDNEFAQNHTFYNTSSGEGYSFIGTERTRAISEEIIFTIYNNISYLSDFTIDEITITSYGVKEFNSTVLSQIGSLYTIGENISWQVEFSLFIPAYYNSWVEIDKPSDWSFVCIIDGFETDMVGCCLGTSYGSEKLIIPNSILGPGLWSLEAISRNYISNGTLGVWDGTKFVNTTQLTFEDLFKISITLNESIFLPNTQINCSIFYPNMSVFWQDSKEPASHAVSLGNFTVGSNMSVGKYIVKILWANSQNFSSLDKVGFKEFDFCVWHHSNLTAETSFFEIVIGDPLLAKVKLTDIDVNSPIAFATVRYNSTFEQSGNMLYWGSGIYLADIDTNSLDLGIHYISVNATMDYYENHSVENLIQVKIVSQALVLDVPHTVIEAVANSYAIVQVNVTGAISGAMIWPVNICTNWQNPYNIIDHNNGSYTLNFSTVDLPSQGIIETFTVTIVANKTNHGETNGFITIAVHPIQTIISVNSSIINVKINEIIDIRLNYTTEESGLLIHGANYSVSWSSLFNLISDDQGIIFQLKTTNLSIGTYTAVIKAEKVGYETAFKTITVIIDYIDIEVNTLNFKDSLEALSGKTSMIIIKLTDPYTDISIDNASVFYSWEFGVGYFNYLNNGTYELELKIPQNTKGNYMMVLVVAKEGSIYKTTEFSILIGVDIPKQANLTIWYILLAFIGVTTVLGIFSLRSYVLLPLKRKRESNLLAKTQKYKDIMNIETIIISNRESGIYLYSKSYNLLKEYQNELLSGFIQAITVVSNEIAGKEKISIKSGKYKDTEKIIELDFKHFNFFISDYKDLRIVFILKKKASERFKNKTAEFLSSMDLLVSDKFKAWDGNLEIFDKNIPPLLEKYFHIYYKEKFKFNPVINIPRITKEGEFNKMVRNLLNVIVLMTRDQEEFYLEDVIRRVHKKNQDKAIEALEVLLERHLIISSLSKNRQ